MATLAANISALATAIRDKLNSKTTKFSTNIGDGSTTSFTITHNLNTLDVIAQIKDSSGNVEIADVNTATVNTITVKFGTAPTTNQYRVTVIG